MLGRDAQLGPKDLNSPNSPNGLKGPKQPKQPKQLKWPWASRRLGARIKQRKNQTRIFEMQNLSFAPYPILSGPRRKKTIPSESSLHRAGESGPRSERRSWSLEAREDRKAREAREAREACEACETKEKVCGLPRRRQFVNSPSSCCSK